VSFTSKASSRSGSRLATNRESAVALGSPKIVVEASFVEWTRDGLLRHPEFIGVRDDKAPREIRREPE
jgi:ATP-dependent DNA ligase